LNSGKITVVEALLRWPQPDGSTISPEQFIPLAESSGLINLFGQWVIQ
jgi:sensor c-di-GMP phosphodiesterase-like protein